MTTLFGILITVALIVGSFVVGAPAPAADEPKQRWHLYGALLDANTGEVLRRAPAVGEDGKPLVFDSPGECVEFAVQMGPMRTEDGKVVVLRCIRGDVLGEQTI